MNVFEITAITFLLKFLKDARINGAKGAHKRNIAGSGWRLIRHRLRSYDAKDE
jgi:hypothetical protein